MVDFLCLTFALVGVSMPIFWLGFFAQKIFSSDLGLLPFGSRLDVASWPTFEPVTGFYLIDALFVYRHAELTLDVLSHLVLPTLVLATVPMALVARMTRANMIETLGKDFIRTARAKGISPAGVIVRHAIPNALIPVVTAIGAQFGYLLGGAVLTETIFGWPGIGVYIIDSINVLDAKPLQAAVMIVGAFFIAINFVTDLSYAAIDPRLRSGGSGAVTADKGVGWRECLLWAFAAIPWLVAAGLALRMRSGRVAAEAERAAGEGAVQWLLPAALALIGLEVALAGYAAWRRGLFPSGVLPAPRAIVRAIRGLLSSVVDFARFVRRHRSAAVGAALVTIMVTAAVFAPGIATHDPMQGLGQYNAPAGKEFWLGADAQGRDLFSRLVWGARYTLLVALAATFVSLVVGTAIGAMAGFFGGAIDTALMRAMDFMMSFPSFLLAVVIAAALGKSLENLMWAVGFIGIPLYARQMRAEALRVKALEFVDAARSLGAGRWRVLVRTVLPNCLTPLIVLATLGIGSAILDVAGLAFLGLGGDPFIPEWGLILKLGWDESSKGAFQVGVSGACILAAVLGFNLLGDGLRDWLDPRMKAR
jgi:peptide/nickel transport system permease protein